MKYARFSRFSHLHLIFCFLFLFACGRKESKTKAPVKDAESVVLAFDVVKAEVDSAWNTIVEDDNEKLFEMKRLLDEVSYTNVYDAKKHKALLERLETLKSIRYNRESMAESDLIDKYDSATQVVMSEVIEYAQNHAQFENYPLMKELINDIMEADHQVLFYRTRYDNAARNYNEFLEVNKEMSDSAGLGTQPLFALEY